MADSKCQTHFSLIPKPCFSFYAYSLFPNLPDLSCKLSHIVSPSPSAVLHGLHHSGTGVPVPSPNFRRNHFVFPFPCLSSGWPKDFMFMCMFILFTLAKQLHLHISFPQPLSQNINQGKSPEHGAEGAFYLGACLVPRQQRCHISSH